MKQKTFIIHNSKNNDYLTRVTRLKVAKNMADLGVSKIVLSPSKI